MRFVFTLLLLILSVQANESLLPSIESEKLQALIDEEEDFFLVDIREHDIIAEGEIDAIDSITIPFNNLDKEATFLLNKKDAKLIIYCRFGKTAQVATKKLLKMGYTNVFYLKGGIQAWLEKGYPIYNAFGAMKLATD